MNPHMSLYLNLLPISLATINKEKAAHKFIIFFLSNFLQRIHSTLPFPIDGVLVFEGPDIIVLN